MHKFAHIPFAKNFCSWMDLNPMEAMLGIILARLRKEMLVRPQ